MKTIPTKTSPAFGIIAPTAYLETYSSQSRFHLVLAHLVDTDNAYADFYRQSSTLGDYIIMDNGAFELGESYEPAKLIQLGERIAADAIVLPDYPGQSSKVTVDAALEWGNEIKDADFQVMFVPQSTVGDQEDWINSYKWAAQTPWIDIIGMSILGIPNAFGSQIERAYARVVMTKLLIDRGIFAFDKYHHYLGLNAGPALEIPSLISMGTMNSCDSSGPVWAGICGQMYTEAADSYLSTRKIDKHVDFNYPWTTKDYVHQAIQTNVSMTLELLDLGA